MPPSLLAPTRTMLRNLRKKGERRIHFHEESPSHRRALLAAFAGGAIRGWVYSSSHRNSNVARERCLKALVADLATVRCQRLVIESRESRDRFDRKTIYEE